MRESNDTAPSGSEGVTGQGCRGRLFGLVSCIASSLRQHISAAVDGWVSEGEAEKMRRALRRRRRRCDQPRASPEAGGEG